LEARNGSNVLGKLPLQEEISRVGRFNKVVRWIPLGSGPSDFYPLQMQPNWREDVAASWVEQLQKRHTEWDVLILDNIPESDSGLPVLEKTLAAIAPVERWVSNGFYSVSTIKNWDEYREQVLRPANKDLFKDMRKMEREAMHLNIERHRTGIFLHMQNLMEMYAQRRTTLGQTNNYNDTARQNFLQEVLASREPQNAVELSILKDADGNAWAFQLDWLDAGTRYHWNHAYNHDFKKYSPGKLLLYKLMEADFGNLEMKSINHMRGMAGYKTTLADTCEHLIMLRVNNPKSWRLRKLEVMRRVVGVFRS
jgi:CelD/BcsL family acetyltransferase involved in cellulose biosynthesis